MSLVLTTAAVAEMLECSEEQVELKARQRELPGLQFGRSWVFPVDALNIALNQMALKQMEARPTPPVRLVKTPPGMGVEFGPRRVQPPPLPTPPERA